MHQANICTTRSFYKETQAVHYRSYISVNVAYYTSTLLNVLNWYWFYLLVRKAVRMAKGTDKADKYA